MLTRDARLAGTHLPASFKPSPTRHADAPVKVFQCHLTALYLRLDDNPSEPLTLGRRTRPERPTAVQARHGLDLHCICNDSTSGDTIRCRRRPSLIMSGPPTALLWLASGPPFAILMAITRPERAKLARKPICTVANRGCLTPLNAVV